MSENKPSRTVSVGFILLMVALGALSPFLSMVCVAMQLPIVALPAIAIAVGSRRSRAAAYVAVGSGAVLTSSLFFGVVYGWVMLVAGVLPALPAVRAMEKRQPFGEQMQSAFFWSVGAMAAGVAILYFVFDGNVVSYYSGVLREAFSGIPDEDLLAIASTLSTLLGENMEVGAVRAFLLQATDEAETMYGLLLPALVVSGACMTALLTVSLGNRARARRGEAAPESYMPLPTWSLPYGLATALLLLLGISRLLAGTGGTWEMAFYAVYYLCAVAFILRLVIWAENLFHRKGVGLPTRIAAYLIATVIAFLLGLIPIVILLGGVMAVTGRGGDLHRFLKHRADNRDHKE